jgi:hypothetical protein
MSKLVKTYDTYWFPDSEGCGYSKRTDTYRFVELETNEEKSAFLVKAIALNEILEANFIKMNSARVEQHSQELKEYTVHLADFSLAMFNYENLPFYKRIFTTRPTKSTPPKVMSYNRGQFHDYLRSLPLFKDLVMFYATTIPEAYFQEIMKDR